MNRQFQLIDVFHEGQFSGNPLAVVSNAEGLSSEEMQRITLLVEFFRDNFSPSADGRRRGLPRPYFYIGTRNAVCRTPDLGELSRLAYGRRNATQRK